VLVVFKRSPLTKSSVILAARCACHSSAGASGCIDFAPVLHHRSGEVGVL
jgi:hypothetical protein